MRHVAALSRSTHSLASFALLHFSSFRLRYRYALQRLTLHTFIRGLPRYARPPLLKAVSFSRRPFAPLPRLRTLRSTSRLSALRTNSRGHGLGLRHGVAKFGGHSLSTVRTTPIRRTVTHHRALSKGLSNGSTLLRTLARTARRDTKE